MKACGNESGGDVFKRNIDSLRNANENLASQVAASTRIADMVISFEGDRLVRVEVAGDSGKQLYLDREGISGQNDFIRNHEDKGLVVFMMGSGYLFAEQDVLTGLCEKNLVVMLEPDVSFLKRILSEVALDKILEHPNFILSVEGAVDLGQLIKSDRHRVFAASGYTVFERDCSVRSYGQWYEMVKSNISQYFTCSWAGLNTFAMYGKNLFLNVMENLPVLLEETPLDTLKDAYKGQTAFVVGAGPSLAGNIEKLKSAGRKGVIIAVDAAVAPLARHGIIPDFLASVDYKESTCEKLAPVRNQLHGISLLTAPECAPSVLKNFSYKNIYYGQLNSNTASLFSYLTGRSLSVFDDCQACLHVAMGAAKVLGFGKIVLCGVDLAYSGSRDHVEGTVLHNGNCQVPDSDFEIEGALGGKVFSSATFIAQKEICEKLIRRNPKALYVDATEGGAKIAGTRVRALGEVIDEMDCVLSRDPVCGNPMGHTDSGDITEKLHGLQNGLQKVQNELLDYGRQRKKIEKYLKGAHEIRVDSFPEKITSHLGSMDRIVSRLNDSGFLKYFMSLFLEFYREFAALESDLILAGSRDERFLASYRQQEFVQTKRAEVVKLALEQVSDQLRQITVRAGFDKDSLGEAQYYFEQGWLSRAEKILERCPQNVAADFLRGCIRICHLDLSEGKNLMEGVVVADPSYAEKVEAFYREVASRWVDSVVPEPSKLMLVHRALELFPGHEKALVLEKELQGKEILMKQRNMLFDARQFYDSGDLASALGVLSGEGEVASEIKAEWFELYARSLLESGRMDEGIAALEEAVAIDPKTAGLWEDLGDAFAGDGNGSLAVMAYEKYLMAIPDGWGVLKKMGDLYLASGNCDSAIAAYRVVLSENPDDHVTMGCLKKALELKIQDDK